MILADKFTCDVPLVGDTFIECSIPSAGVLEWMTAFGTVGATVVALVFGALAWKNEKAAHKYRLKSEQASREEQKRRNLEERFEVICQALYEKAQTFPQGEPGMSFGYLGKFMTYKSFFPESIEGYRLRNLVHEVSELFFSVHRRYSTRKNVPSNTDELGIDSQNSSAEEAKRILELIAARFEHALQYWHRTGENIEGVELALESTLTSAKEYVSKLENRKDQ